MSFAEYIKPQREFYSMYILKTKIIKKKDFYLLNKKHEKDSVTSELNTIPKKLFVLLFLYQISIKGFSHFSLSFTNLENTYFHLAVSRYQYKCSHFSTFF